MGYRVLVAGATGRLGGVVNVLREHGHEVRAMTRDPAAVPGGVYGDFDDVDSLVRAAQGVDAFFATGTAHRAGPEGELRHGRNVAEAAAGAGVPHLVYVSGDGAATDMPLPLFRAKGQVEEAIRASGVPATILAPVYFAENLFNPWNLPALADGVFPSPVDVDVPLQQVAIADVERFAALAIERRLLGRFPLASDALTGREAAAAIERATGRRLEARRTVPPFLAPVLGWLERYRGGADPAALRRDYPEVGWQRYAEWARAEHARLEQAMRPRPAPAPPAPSPAAC
jgi:uncharacterized protein YbjT (DUF2867 family)